jgi:hypothetical protein
MTFTGDELILVLVSLVRATRPSMLRQEGDGFTIDFEAIASGKSSTDADRLLLKIRALMESPTENAPDGSSLSLDLDATEARRIVDALAKLELLQAWPEDVVNMSRALRARLVSGSTSAQ